MKRKRIITEIKTFCSTSRSKKKNIRSLLEQRREDFVKIKTDRNESWQKRLDSAERELNKVEKENEWRKQHKMFLLDIKIERERLQKIYNMAHPTISSCYNMN